LVPLLVIVAVSLVPPDTVMPVPAATELTMFGRFITLELPGVFVTDAWVPETSTAITPLLITYAVSVEPSKISIPTPGRMLLTMFGRVIALLPPGEFTTEAWVPDTVTEVTPSFLTVADALVPPDTIIPVPATTELTMFEGMVSVVAPDTVFAEICVPPVVATESTPEFASVGAEPVPLAVSPAPTETERTPVFAIVAADGVPPIKIPPVPVPYAPVAAASERRPVAVAFTIGAVGVPVIVTPDPAFTDVTALPPEFSVDRYAHTDPDGSPLATTRGPRVLPIQSDD
jgi:hypothetical protein